MTRAPVRRLSPVAAGIRPAALAAALCAAVAAPQASDVLVRGGDLSGHTSWVYALAFTPDGRHLVSGSYDSTVRVWEVATGRLVSTISANFWCVTSVAVSADGRRIASGGRDNRVRLWDLESGRPLGELRGHDDWVYAVALSRDGRYVVSGSKDTTVKLWEVATGQAIQTFRGHEDAVSSVAITPDGERVVSGSGGDRNSMETGGDGTVRVWSARTGAALHVLRGHGDGISGLAVTPDSTQVVSGSYDGTSRLWDLVNGRLLRVLARTDNKVLAVAIDGRGERAYSLSYHDEVFVHRLPDGEAVREFATGGVGLAASPDGNLVATGHQQDIELWDAATGANVRHLAGRTSEVEAMALSADGTRVAAADLEGTLRVYETATGSELHGFQAHQAIVFALAFHPSAPYLLSGGSDRRVSQWDVATGRFVRNFEGHRDAVRSIALSADGRFLATGADDHEIRVWDFWSGKPLKVLKGHASPVTGLAITREGALVSGSWNNTVKLWDLNRGREIWSVEVPNSPLATPSVGDDEILIGGWDGQVRALDRRNGRVVRTLLAHEHWVLSLAVNGDGSRIATGGGDKAIHVWSRDGRLLATLAGHTDGVGDLAFAPDGRTIVSAGDDTIRFWDLPTERETRRFHFLRLAGPERAEQTAGSDPESAARLDAARRTWKRIRP